MGYLLCESCREGSASPVDGFSLWEPSSIHRINGAENRPSYAETVLRIRDGLPKMRDSPGELADPESSCPNRDSTRPRVIEIVRSVLTAWMLLFRVSNGQTAEQRD